MQFIRFLAVGVSNTLVSYLLYTGSLYLFQKYDMFGGKDYLAAQVIAFVLSVLWAYFWNRDFVFEQKKKQSALRTLAKTYAVYSIGELFVKGLLLAVLVDRLGVSKMIAPLFTLAVTVPLNYFLNKYWTFG